MQHNGRVDGGSSSNGAYKLEDEAEAKTGRKDGADATDRHRGEEAPDNGATLSKLESATATSSTAETRWWRRQR